MTTTHPIIDAVLEQLGGDDDARETLSEVARNCQADAGWGGFCYYSETSEFFQENKSVIVDLATEMAEEFGQDVVSFVAGFGCLTDDRETRDEIGRAIYGTPEEDDVNVQNALAWFALESAARMAHPEI